MDVTPGLRRDPAPDLDAVGQDEELVARIRDEIARDGPITFARFMDLALYDPDGGYYRAEAARPGRDGDFLTAPEAHPIFGAALSRAVADAWDRLDRPEPFVLREYGAGTGTLAPAILTASPRSGRTSRRRIRYEPIEVEPRRLEAIAARLEAAGHGRSPGRPRRRIAPVDGFVLANEVLDALRRTASSSGPATFARSWSDRATARSSTSRPTHRRPRWRAAWPTTASPSPTASERRSASRSMAGSPPRRPASRRGVLLLIDYGYPAAELYDPVRRRDGTLRAYLRHRVHDDPYLHVGRQDLTAHVDVTAVERAAAAAGLTHLGTTTQAEFLVGLGTEDLLHAIQADPATTMEDYLAVRSALVRLLDPAAMGRFRVMAFGRGWPDGPPLAGLGYRLAR